MKIKRNTEKFKDEMEQQSKVNLSFLKDGWKSAIVARRSMAEFTGNTITPSRMSNLDSKGLGPPERIRIGRQVCYPVDSLIRWMQSRSRGIRSDAK